MRERESERRCDLLKGALRKLFHDVHRKKVLQKFLRIKMTINHSQLYNLFSKVFSVKDLFMNVEYN